MTRKKEKGEEKTEEKESGVNFKRTPFSQQKRGSFIASPPATRPSSIYEETCSLFTYIENISLAQERPPIAARRAAQLQGGGEEDPGQHTGEAGGI